LDEDEDDDEQEGLLPLFDHAHTQLLSQAEVT